MEQANPQEQLPILSLSKSSSSEGPSQQSQKQLLDWKRFLYDENTQIEMIKFQKWDRNLDFKQKEDIIKDMNRTRNSEPFFKKEKTQKNLQLIATFYCRSNLVNYNQGLLEIIAPFLLLRSPTFDLSKCYAYFNSFMNKYFPQILKARSHGEDKVALPHALCAFALCKFLLSYHSRKLMNVFIELGIELTVTLPRLLLTMFSQGTPLPLVYLIYNEYLKRNNSNYLFYLSISMILQKEQEIFSFTEEDEQMAFINKNIKNLNTEEDVFQIFAKADEIKAKTPKSFETFVDSIGFNNRAILSVEDIGMMKHLDTFQDLIPLYTNEIVDSRRQLALSKSMLRNASSNQNEKSISFNSNSNSQFSATTSLNATSSNQDSLNSSSNNNNSNNNPQKLFYIIDCRDSRLKPIALPNTIAVIKITDPPKQSEAELVRIVKARENKDKSQAHFVLAISSAQGVEEVKLMQAMLQALIRENVNHISMLYDTNKLEAFASVKETRKLRKSQEESKSGSVIKKQSESSCSVF